MKCRPRAGGGVPSGSNGTATGEPSSPRRRGCSVDAALNVSASKVVPAQAGVFHSNWSSMTSLALSSPRRRGCSEMRKLNNVANEVVPAQAGVFRG